MRVVYSEQHRRHNPRHDVDSGVPVSMVEVPARAEHILAALEQDRAFTIEPPTAHGIEPIQAVHSPGLIAFLEHAWQSWRSVSRSPEMFPDTMLLQGLREGMDTLTAPEPRSPVGQIGYWCFDTGTPIVEGTYAAARAAVDVALTTADRVLHGESMAYGLCRPPGHHAGRSVFGGFCYFNNAAIAAEYLLQRGRSPLAVLDLDYHHGNGTQQIFYRRGEVLYVSLHADPLHAFPFFTGHADEIGAGPGAGTTLNIALPAGTSDEAYLSALDRALDMLVQFQPAILVVSVGIDTYVHDPLGDFVLTTAVYRECGRRVAATAIPLVILQEGGYYLPDLGDNVHQWLSGALSK